AQKSERPGRRNAPGSLPKSWRQDATNWLGGARKPESPIDRRPCWLQPERAGRGYPGPAEPAAEPARAWRIQIPAPADAPQDRENPVDDSPGTAAGAPP